MKGLASIPTFLWMKRGLAASARQSLGCSPAQPIPAGADDSFSKASLRSGRSHSAHRRHLSCGGAGRGSRCRRRRGGVAKPPEGEGLLPEKCTGCPRRGAGEEDRGVGAGCLPDVFVQPVHWHPGREREWARFVWCPMALRVHRQIHRFYRSAFRRPRCKKKTKTKPNRNQTKKTQKTLKQTKTNTCWKENTYTYLPY